MAHKIFLTGATGYIGGSILNKLLQHPDKYSVTALVRDDKKAQELARLGVTTIDGDLNHQEALFMASEEADAVINAADADHLGAAKSIVKGLKAKNNKAAVFLHTSGTGVLCSEPTTDTPFDDEDMARIRKIPINAPHKEVDEWIFNNCDDITFAIIAPSTIYGLGRGPCKKLSVQIPALARAAVKRKKAGWVGSKETRWGNVHIDDLVDLYILVLDGLLAGKIPQGKEGGWYFGSHGEHNWGQIAEHLGAILYKKGLVDTKDVSPFEDKIVDEMLFGDVGRVIFGHESRCVANRSKRIGWKPKDKPSIFDTMEEEVQFMIDNGLLDSVKASS